MKINIFYERYDWARKLYEDLLKKYSVEMYNIYALRDYMFIRYSDLSIVEGCVPCQYLSEIKKHSAQVYFQDCMEELEYTKERIDEYSETGDRDIL